MALFCGRDDRSAAADVLEAEIERLDRLPLPALAAEVMGRAFGPGAEWEDPEDEVTVSGAGAAGATVEGVAARMEPDDAIGGGDEPARLRLQRVVAEGIQALEHAALVRPQVHAAVDGLDYAPTRLGRKALATGSVAQVVEGGQAP